MSETAVQESEAAKEDIRIANENKRGGGEGEKPNKKPSKSLIDDTDDELCDIEAETQRLKAQQKILT